MLTNKNLGNSGFCVNISPFWGSSRLGGSSSASYTLLSAIQTTYKVYSTRDVEEYRQTIQTWVNPQDKVLEIGCEWGTTSVLIYERCKNLIATDISLDCIQVARQKHPPGNSVCGKIQIFSEFLYPKSHLTPETQYETIVRMCAPWFSPVTTGRKRYYQLKISCIIL